jgi:hypothetical protein
VIILLLFGGEFWGVTAGSIKKYFSNDTKKQEVLQNGHNEILSDIHSDVNKEDSGGVVAPDPVK